jgi:hypothetical protein
MLFMAPKLYNGSNFIFWGFCLGVGLGWGCEHFCSE